MTSTPESYDVIVVGAGTAGIPCAINAAEAGSRVLLIDKDHRIGGTLHVTGGHLSAAGTRLQAAKGIEDSPAAHLADIERLSKGTARMDIVERAVHLAPVTLDWLDDNGFPFTEESPERPTEHEPYSVARTYTGAEAGLSVLQILERHLQPHVDSGAVDLRRSTALIGLLQDDDDAVVGIEAVDQAGRDLTFHAPAVVLATGGFGANPELFTELVGRPLRSSTRATSTGDGLEVARAIGAAIAGQDKHLPTFGGLPDPQSSWRSPIQPRAQLNSAVRTPWEIYVDKHGARFVAEDIPGSDAKERALFDDVEDMVFWVVLDQVGVERGDPLIPGYGPAELLQAQRERRGVHVADTLAELATKAGIDPAGLAATVERYNAAIAAGEPDELGREQRPAPIEQGPFYAVQNHGVALVVFAGLDVSTDLEVRRADGSVIRGLYAVGEVIGNGATAGHAFCSGMQVTPALSLGRWLGTELASRATANN